MNYIAQNIKAIRKQNGLTQAEFALKINNKRDNIASWELGKSLPSVEILQVISDIFHINLTELISADLSEKFDDNMLQESHSEIYYKHNSKSAVELVKFLQDELKVKNEVIKSLLKVINKKE